MNNNKITINVKDSEIYSLTHHFVGIRPSLKIKINGIVINSLLDSGSNYCVMSSDLADLLRVKIERTDLEVSSAFSDSTKLLGICYLRFDFNGEEKRHICQILPNSSCPLLMALFLCMT